MSGSKQRSLKSIAEAAIDACRSRGMPVDHVEVIRIEKVVVFTGKPGDAVVTSINETDLDKWLKKHEGAVEGN
jgi:hypothetical protein